MVNQPRQPVSGDLVLDGFGAHCSKERWGELAQFNVMGQDNQSTECSPTLERFDVSIILKEPFMVLLEDTISWLSVSPENCI